MQTLPKRIAEMDRLVHAAHRFAKICRNNPVKLFGLLYLLDIRHFREIGQSCTGETYYAMADGPAPGTLRSLLVMRDLDMDAAIGMLTATTGSGPWHFDPRHFCTHALNTMHELEATYYKADPQDLNLDDGNAWWRVYTKGRGVGAVIPYELTLLGTAKETGVERNLERKGFPLTVQQRQSLPYHIPQTTQQFY